VTPGKRLLDLGLASLLLVLLSPVILFGAALLWAREGRPILYRSERMRAPDEPFRLLKFRTMHLGADRAGGVTGGDKSALSSPLHRLIRRTRADELPQLWNVLRGDMSLVGPRPPLRRYVEAYPDLYAEVLRSRPGMTGLASLRVAAREERLLAACRTPEETEATYRRACIPLKARLDLLYQRNRTLLWDLALLAETAARPFRRHRAARRPRAGQVAAALGAGAPAGPAAPAPERIH
jgi:lipopolysaccharide/colanic/teichoic acid biosynthesis glycosyltransferase